MFGFNCYLVFYIFLNLYRGIIAILFYITLMFKAMKIPKISKQYILSTNIKVLHMAVTKSPSGRLPKDKMYCSFW